MVAVNHHQHFCCLVSFFCFFLFKCNVEEKKKSHPDLNIYEKNNSSSSLFVSFVCSVCESISKNQYYSQIYYTQVISYHIIHTHTNTHINITKRISSFVEMLECQSANVCV